MKHMMKIDKQQASLAYNRQKDFESLFIQVCITTHNFVGFSNVQGFI